MCYPLLGDPRMPWRTVFTAVLLCFATAAYAEVADMNASGFLTRHEVKYLYKPFPVEGLIRCVKEALS